LVSLKSVLLKLLITPYFTHAVIAKLNLTPGHFTYQDLTDSAADSQQLLQFRVLCFGLLQDGDVTVGLFPEGKEILIGGFVLAVSPCMA
jgi:hypothetical protein